MGKTKDSAGGKAAAKRQAAALRELEALIAAGQQVAAAGAALEAAGAALAPVTGREARKGIATLADQVAALVGKEVRRVARLRATVAAAGAAAARALPMTGSDPIVARVVEDTGSRVSVRELRASELRAMARDGIALEVPKRHGVEFLGWGGGGGRSTTGHDPATVPVEFRGGAGGSYGPHGSRLNGGGSGGRSTTGHDPAEG